MVMNLTMARVTESDIDQAISSATEKLGYKELRCTQSRYWLLGIFLHGNDVFVSLPTGSGKSLLLPSSPGVRPSSPDLSSSIIYHLSNKSPDHINTRSSEMVT